MKSIVELNAELDALRAEARSITDAAKAEERRLSDEEDARYRGIVADIEAKKAEITTATEHQRNINKNNQQKNKYH